MKIKHENSEYELNVQAAINDGYLKRVKSIVTDVQPGDVFNSRQDKTGFNVVLSQEVTGKFVIGNRGGNLFSLFDDKPRTKAEMVEFVNNIGWLYMGSFKFKLPEFSKNPLGVN